MRSLLLAVILAISTWALGQDPVQTPAVSGLFGKVKPDVTIVVKKHPTGADMVEITMLNAKYPPELLQERIKQLGKNLGSEPRGLSVGTYALGGETNDNLKFVKGSFAVDGIIDIANRRLKIQEIIRAFVGDPEDIAIKGFSIFFSGLKQDTNYVQSFMGEHVRGEARVQGNPISGIEYRIEVDTNKPDEITFPDHAPERISAPPPSQPEKSSGASLWIAIALAALAAGALVYLAVIRSGQTKAR